MCENQYYIHTENVNWIPVETNWSINIFAKPKQYFLSVSFHLTLVCKSCKRTCFPLQLLVWLPVVSVTRQLLVEWNLCRMFLLDLADLSEKHCLLWTRYIVTYVHYVAWSWEISFYDCSGAVNHSLCFKHWTVCYTVQFILREAV